MIPAESQLAGTFRYFEEQDARLIAERITEICAGLATAHGVQIDIDIRQVFDVLINDPERVENLISSASDIVGGQARADAELTMGSEDMADLLRIVPGAFFNLGHDGEVPLHNPGFLFDDTILPVGASLLAHLVESRGKA